MDDPGVLAESRRSRQLAAHRAQARAHAFHNVVLPTTTHGSDPAALRHQPNAAQAALLDRLGITLPKRMRLAEHELLAAAATA